MTPSARLDAFAELCGALTGFDAAHLVGTGNVAPFWNHLVDRTGDAHADVLLTTWSARVRDAEDPARAMRLHVLGDARLGPIARNLIRLWFVGTWKALPADWRAAYAPGRQDGDIIPASRAYTEGLLWPTVGANPPGAKPFGYAMWAKPPRVTLDTKDTSHA